MGRVGQIIHRGSLAFRRRYVARGLILIYHRVAEDPVDPWRLCVSPENFARHMGLLRKKGFKTVHVSEVARSLRARASVIWGLRPQTPDSLARETRRMDRRRHVSARSRGLASLRSLGWGGLGC